MIKRDSLMSLETYARERVSFRAKVLEHKKNRTVHLGEHVTLQFEDELTIRYQVQEMLRIERIFEEDGIQGELDAYNPLVPDGSNWKATMLIEYPDVEERRRMLAALKGIERRVLVEVAGLRARCMPSPTRTSSARPRRRPLRCISCASSSTAAMREALRRGAAVTVGVDHPQYRASTPLPANARDALAADLQQH